MIVLLLTGIRNAWDMVTFLAVERAHSEDKRQDSTQETQQVEQSKK
jgi:hypothetical protein